jgi:hypothetical protein
MIDIGRREPHDEKTPEAAADWVVQDWDQNALRGIPQPPLAAAVLDALVYKAFFEEAESALRWLDPEGDVLARIGIRP